MTTRLQIDFLVVTDTLIWGSLSIIIEIKALPKLFSFLEEKGKIDKKEMYRVFNMGIGMIAVIPQDQKAEALALIQDAFIIGEIIQGHELNWK